MSKFKKKTHPWALHENAIVKANKHKEEYPNVNDYEIIGISKEELIGLALRGYLCNTKSSCNTDEFYKILQATINALMVLLNNNAVKELDPDIACKILKATIEQNTLFL